MDSRLHPKFEIATIKPASPDASSQGFQIRPPRIQAVNERLSDVLCIAFNIHSAQLVNAPDWFSNRYDIVGKPDLPGVPTWPQQREMYRTLLEERFSLRYHHESRDMARFTVRLTHEMSKLVSTKTPPEEDMQDQSGSDDAGKHQWRFTDNNMAAFAEFLQTYLNRPVLDETGLTGKYDFKLEWADENASSTRDTGGLPGLLSAVKEQLGLKVETSRGPTDVIVIDHIEPPSDN